MTKPSCYRRTTSETVATVTLTDWDGGTLYCQTNLTVVIDPSGNPWGYFNTTSPAWRGNQFNQLGFDLWSPGPIITSYFFGENAFNPHGGIRNWGS